jgi:transketolase
MHKLAAGLEELNLAARLVRAHIVELSHRARTPHLGSALSCVDILVALYWTNPALDPTKAKTAERDRFILSKGHAATALYAILARRGYFPRGLLDQYAIAGSPLPEHPVLGSVPGVEVTSGSLGHGLSLGLGMALAGGIQGLEYRVYVLLSDGECNEGSVWEAAMMAPAHNLEKIVAIVDYNKWQATGRSEEILALAPLARKWDAFGWSVKEVDGHDFGALSEALSQVPDGSGKPVAIIAHTVKGKGVSFMEDDNNWHYRIPTGEEVKKALYELGLE